MSFLMLCFPIQVNSSSNVSVDEECFFLGNIVADMNTEKEPLSFYDVRAVQLHLMNMLSPGESQEYILAYEDTIAQLSDSSVAEGIDWYDARIMSLLVMSPEFSSSFQKYLLPCETR